MTTESNPTFPDEPVGTSVEQSTPTYSLAPLEGREKARAEYEGERLELQRRKGKREDEQWKYTKKEKERDAE
ncbi:hypothetical protein LINPERPRIM_LOCUS14437 [Linum perenne]